MTTPTMKQIIEALVSHNLLVKSTIIGEEYQYDISANCDYIFMMFNSNDGGYIQLTHIENDETTDSGFIGYPVGIYFEEELTVDNFRLCKIIDPADVFAELDLV